MKKKIFLITKTPLKDDDGNIEGTIGTSVDITLERKARELEKTVLNEKVEMMRLMGASIAHELRTPLRAISAGAGGIKSYLPKLIASYQIAKQADLDLPFIAPDIYKSLQHSLENIESETRSAFNFIDMLLIKAQLLDIKSYQLTSCSITHCVKEALRRYAFDTNDEELIHWKAENDFTFLGDELLMVHVLFNLLKNAIYYIKVAGKGQIDIWCAGSTHENYLYFRDTGKGITADNLPKIFDQFFTETMHGSGIGLTFCRMVMHGFNGEIECDSKEGEYTLFTMNFPKMAKG